MKQTTLHVIILLLTMSEKMFIIISSFVFGYCIGYYSFELLKRRNPKDEINDFILSYTRKKGIQRRVFDKKNWNKSKLAMIVFWVMICLMKKNFW